MRPCLHGSICIHVSHTWMLRQGTRLCEWLACRPRRWMETALREWKQKSMCVCTHTTNSRLIQVTQVCPAKRPRIHWRTRIDQTTHTHKNAHRKPLIQESERSSELISAFLVIKYEEIKKLIQDVISCCLIKGASVQEYITHTANIALSWVIKCSPTGLNQLRSNTLL